MGGGLEACESCQPEFIRVSADANPLTPQDLISAPLNEWNSIIEQHGPPADLDEFERNLNNQLNQSLAGMQGIGAYNVAHQLNRFHHGQGSIDPAGGNAATTTLYNRVMDMVNGDNPEFGKSENWAEIESAVRDVANELAEEYKAKAGEVMEGLREPEPSIEPEVAPETGVQVTPDAINI